MLLGLALLMLAGCQNQNEKPVMRSEEPYTPEYSSLDSMDAVPAASTSGSDSDSQSGAYSQPEPATGGFARSTADDSAASDEVLDPVGGQVYTVQKGDSLYKLARRFYSDQARWRDIWNANRDQISDPDVLRIGMTLVIP
jgi:nucleoid-associated protein YgaU